MSTPTPEGAVLLAFLERVERLEADKAQIADDIKEVFAEAKGQGYDTAIMRQLIKLRGKDSDQRQEQQALLELYMAAVGMA